MQLTLNQAELEEAIEDYVRSQININDDQNISIDLKATRGSEGNTAVIDIRKGNAKPAKTAKPVYRGNKPGPKPKAVQPEPEAEDGDALAKYADYGRQKPGERAQDEAPEAEAAEGTSILGNHDGNLDDDLSDKLEEDVANEAQPEAAEEKPARTPGSIFSRAG